MLPLHANAMSHRIHLNGFNAAEIRDRCLNEPTAGGTIHATGIEGCLSIRSVDVGERLQHFVAVKRLPLSAFLRRPSNTRLGRIAHRVIAAHA